MCAQLLNYKENREYRISDSLQTITLTAFSLDKSTEKVSLSLNRKYKTTSTASVPVKQLSMKRILWRRRFNSTLLRTCSTRSFQICVCLKGPEKF